MGTGNAGTARRRTLIADILAKLPGETQRAVAEALRRSRTRAGEVPDSQWPSPRPADEATAAGRRITERDGTPVTDARPHPAAARAGQAAGWLRAGRIGLLAAAPDSSAEHHPGGEHDAQPADQETSHHK